MSRIRGVLVDPLLSVIMPVYNEARTLRRIVKAVLDSPVDLEIELICVDDHSTDDTPKILSELSLADDRIRVIRHAVNCGKGSAIRRERARITTTTSTSPAKTQRQEK